MAWTPEALIPSKDLEAFVQVDINSAEEIECNIYKKIIVNL